MATDLITRANVSSLIPEDVAQEILTNINKESAALQFFRRRDLKTNQQRESVLEALPAAYFVNGEGGMKATTTVSWKNKFLNVEEIACIVVMPKNTVNDLGGGDALWGRLKPLIETAVARALDGAVFFGYNKPANWDVDVVTHAVNAGNFYTRGTSTTAQGGLAEDLNQLMGLVEADGFTPKGFVTDIRQKKRYRGARDTTGQKILDVKESTLNDLPVAYTLEGLWPNGASAEELITGDYDQGIIGVRQDMEMEFFNSGVIQDPVTGAIVYNLIQQNLYAWRVDARFAWAVANPINWINQIEATRSPFGVLLAP